MDSQKWVKVWKKIARNEVKELRPLLHFSSAEMLAELLEDDIYPEFKGMVRQESVPVFTLSDIMSRCDDIVKRNAYEPDKADYLRRHNWRGACRSIPVEVYCDRRVLGSSTWTAHIPRTLTMALEGRLVSCGTEVLWREQRYVVVADHFVNTRNGDPSLFSLPHLEELALARAEYIDLKS